MINMIGMWLVPAVMHKMHNIAVKGELLPLKEARFRNVRANRWATENVRAEKLSP